MPYSSKICICACEEESVAALEKLGYEVLTTSAVAGAGDEISRHPDIQMCVLPSGETVIHESCRELAGRLISTGRKVTCVKHEYGDYPKDVAFNIAVTGGIAVGRKNAVQPDLLKLIEGEFIDIRQGYAKCSTCIVGENAVITEDVTVARAFESRGFDVLIIEKGDVYLSEKHYGFFGGATGLDGNTLYINGDLETHRNCEAITAFLKKHGANPVMLKKGRITDVGSLFFV